MNRPPHRLSQLLYGSKRLMPTLRPLAVAALTSLIGWQPRLQAADLKLASFFGDHMVLQRDRQLCVWGTGAPGATVEVSIASRHASAMVDTNACWRVCLDPVRAGGPYVLQAVSGGNTAALNDVLFGDVWLCSGQSNMQMPAKECDPAEQALLASHPRLRLCTVGKSSSRTPQTSADIRWRTCTPESARNFSAVGYFFAAELRQDHKLDKVPLGIIDSSYGGTTCEGWIPAASLAAFDAKDLHDSMFGIKPAGLYNAMISPLGNAPLKGVLWYQGESNSGHPNAYPQLLATLIRDWRKQFDTPALPFLIVQLPDYAYQWDGFYWPWERAAQQAAVQSTPNTALVLGIETTDGFNLHPHQKLEIGRRASLAARREVYGERVVDSGPVFQSAQVAGSALRVNFKADGNGLSNRVPGAVRGFMVAGGDGVYHFADGTIDGSSVIVKSDAVPAPETVRYAWAGVPNSTLVNNCGLPAAPFRTDNLPISNVEVQKEPVSHHLTTPAYDLTVDGGGKVTSLIVQDAQFLSNDPGTDGGTSLPGAFGPRSLSDIQCLGPNLLSCSDNEVTLLLKFQENEMEWVLTNRGKNETTFSVALAQGVSAAQVPASNAFVLTRKNASLKVQGVDSVADAANGKVLKINVKVGESRRLQFRLDR